MNIFLSLDWLLLFIRLVLGVIFIYYGWPKIKNLRANAESFVKMGFTPGIFWGTIIAILEFFGALTVILGIYAELTALLFMFHMATGTFWKIKLKKPFSDYSYDIQLFTLSAVIAFFGAGAYAVASFKAAPFLRWDAVLGIIIVAAALAYFSRPQK